MIAATKVIPEFSESEKIRFWEKVNIGSRNDCWEWKASKDQRGYGYFQKNGGCYKAHRISFFLSGGVHPEGKPFVLHACDNPKCVNPDHLWPGSPRDNMLDMINKGRKSSTAGDRNPSRLRPECRAKGSAHGISKLTEASVSEMRHIYAEGGTTQRDLARKFGITQSNVSFIISNKTWAHI